MSEYIRLTVSAVGNYLSDIDLPTMPRILRHTFCFARLYRTYSNYDINSVDRVKVFAILLWK